MAGRIAGITIEIDGNTTKLQSALAGVNSTLRTTKTALKDVDKLLKFNPTNSDLLRQKQQLLGTAITDTKSKLETLRTAMDQMKNADGFDENSKDVQDLQREIIDTETELKRLEEQAKQAASVFGSQMQAVGQKIQDAGAKLTAVGEGLTRNLTVPLAAVGAASVKAFNDVDAGTDTIIQKTGATGDALHAMQQSMENIATSIPTTFETAGAAIGEVATRFDLTGDALEDLSARFIKFADLNGIDVSSAIDNVQSAMAAFGLEAKDAGAFLDTLNAVAQRTGTGVDKLSSEMTTNAAALKEMGFNASDAANFLGDLSKNGIDSSTVITGLNKAFVKATSEGKTMEEALAELQDTMSNAETDTEAYAAAMELFGNRAGPRLAEALQSGRLSLDELGTSLDDNLGNVESTFEATLDPIDQFKTFMNQAKVTGAELGNTLMETLLPILEKMRDGLEKLQEKWNNLDDSTKETIVKVALIAAALGPVLALVGKLTSGVGSLVSMGGSLISTFAGMGAGAGAAGAGIGAAVGPILAVVAAVGALIAVFVSLYQNNEDFRNKVNEIWPQIKETIGGTLETIQAIIQTFIDIVSLIWDQWGEQIYAVVVTKFEEVKAVISGALAMIQGLLQVFASILQGDWAGAWEGVKGIAQTYWETIQTVIGSKLDNLKAKFDLAKEMFSTIFGQAWDNIKNAAQTKWEEIKQKITTPIEQARDKIRGIIETIKGLFKFDFPIPHIKLPHLTITGSLSLVPPSVPSFSVQWYKKAYNNPYIFTAPTVVNGMGFGDGNGAEMVYGRDQLMRDITEAMSKGISADAIYNAVREGAAASNTSVVIGDREFARILRNMGVAMA